MSTSPPPKRTKTSDNAIPNLNEQQEIDQTSSHPEWRSFPPGVRFCPFDDELIVYYLQKKVKNEPMPYNRIQDVNIYMHNPQHLADQYQALGDDIWYFFSPRDRIYRNGERPKRAAGEGYWKATGVDEPIEHHGRVIGKKKSLVFYLGQSRKGDKTDWIMKEYTVDTPPRVKKDEHDMRLDDWVLCKIYKKAPRKPKKGGQEETPQLALWRSFPPGVRFCPFDDELIVYYLQKKVKNEPMPYNRIQDVNIYMHNPEHLADQYQALGDDIWYFFSPRDRIHRNGERPKRAAGEGYWKATRADEPIEHQGRVIGKKKSLVFYLGKSRKGDKTDWIMKEYTVDTPPRVKTDEHDMRLDDWVLCKIYKKAPRKPKKGGQEETPQLALW